MNRFHRFSNLIPSLATALVTLATTSDASAQFAAGDEVRLTKEVPLLFNGNRYRDGKSGEIFTVFQHRAAERKIYVLQTDSAGKQFAITIDEGAITIVEPDSYLLLVRGIGAIATGDYAAASRLLERADLADGGVSVATGLKTFAQNLQIAAAELARAVAAEKQIQPELERRLRNARVTNRPNLLTGGNENQVRAEGIVADARRLAETHRDAVEKARGQFAEALKMGTSAIETLAASQCFAAALALDDALVAVSRKNGDRERAIIGSYEREQYAKKAAEAESAWKAVRNAQKNRQLFAAMAHVETGLAAERGRGDLRKSRAELSAMINRVRALLKEALTLQEAKKFEDALVKLKEGEAQCSDFGDLNTCLAAISAIVAEKPLKLVKAKTAEEAGDFAAAYAVYDLYGMQDGRTRVLPLLAKAQENAGSFLEAYATYEVAGMTADMQRLRNMKEEQEGAYRKAKLLLSELKFDEALTIFERYKDRVARADALKQKGAWQESENRFEDALGSFREAELPQEVTRVREYMAKRKQWLEEASQLEQAENWDKSLDLFRRARATGEVARLSRKIAETRERAKDYATAVEYFEQAGAYMEAARLRKAHDLTSMPGRELSPKEIFRRCGPACVTVVAGASDGVGVGSGFFVSKGGYLLTNHHVVDGSSKVAIIMPDGKFVPAVVLDQSDTPDLALLKVELSEHPVLRLGDSSTIETGSAVYAIGSPKNLPQSFSDGIISNAQRDFKGNACFQINVAINHGNSGGPLLDQFGSVIGINTFGEGTAVVMRNGKNIGSDIQGINYAIKIKEAAAFLKKNGL